MQESIWFGDEAITRLNRLLSGANFSKVFFLTDENSHDLCLTVLLPQLENLPEMEILEVAPGEESKSPEVLLQLWYALSGLEADRNSLVINLGGGMITDLGGLLAGTYLRGLTFINIPTSLLAMVDASYGGKNGINLDGLKNRVGLFLEPTAVCVIPEFLETLPVEERRSGFAEMLKHGLIKDRAYWQSCCNFDIVNEIPSLGLISHSINIKKQVVDRDYREEGLRKILNFGHSIGHAFESASINTSKSLLHGEAVALGMLAELKLSVKYAALDPEEEKEASQAIHKIYGDIELDFDVSELMSLMRHDKKNLHGKYRFSLLRKIGEATPEVEVNEKDIKEVLTRMMRT